MAEHSMTYGDLVRSLKDASLAYVLSCPITNGLTRDDSFCKHGSCYDCTLRWLSSPCSDDAIAWLEYIEEVYEEVIK